MSTYELSDFVWALARIESDAQDNLLNRICGEGCILSFPDMIQLTWYSAVGPDHRVLSWETVPPL